MAQNASVTDNQPIEELTEPAYKQRSALTSIILVAACTGAMFVNTTGTTAVNIAVPSIAKDLRIPDNEIQWLVSAFTLSAGCLLLLFGRLADLFGRKRVFIIGNVWIVVLSLGCSFAQNKLQLIILRAFHGFGPASTIPAALGILAHSFPPSRQRSAAFATFAAGAPLGGALGNVMGGVFVTYVSNWRGVFWLIGGLAFIAGTLGFFTIDPDKHCPDTNKRVDWLGAALVTCGLVSINYVLGEGNSARPRGWGSPSIIILAVIGVILIATFIWWEHWVTKNSSTLPPLMPLSIWKRANGKFAAIQFVGFFAWACFVGLVFWATLYYQNYKKYTAMETMLRFIPMSVTGVICNVIVALLVGHINGAYLLMLGCTATGLAALLFAIIDPSAMFWEFGFPASILSVFGADFIFACGTLFIAKVSTGGDQSLAGALFQTLQQLGTSFGLAVSTIAQVTAERRHKKWVWENNGGGGFPPPPPFGVSPPAKGPGGPPGLGGPPFGNPEAMLKGYRAAQYTCFAFAMIALLLVVVFLRDIGVVGDRKKKETSVEGAVDGDDPGMVEAGVVSTTTTTNEREQITEKEKAPVKQ